MPDTVTRSGLQRTKTFDRKLDAERFLTVVESAKLSGAYVDPARAKTTLGDAADRWIDGKINLKPTTRARYAAALEVHVRPRWGGIALDRVEHGDIQSWLAELMASGQSAASVRKAFGVLSAVLAMAVRDRRISHNPAEGVSLPRLVERRVRYLTAEQVVRLASVAAEAPQPRLTLAYAQNGLAVLVLAYCGLRWGELAALRVGSVDLMRRRLHIVESMTEVNGARIVWGTPKTHETRWVPVPRFLVDGLARHIAGRGERDLVFTTPTGQPMRNRNARRSWFDRAAAAIGEPDLTPRGLRHTAASLAVSAGANV